MSGRILPTRLPPNAQTGGHRALGGPQAGNDMWSHDQVWSQLFEDRQTRTKQSARATFPVVAVPVVAGSHRYVQML